MSNPFFANDSLSYDHLVRVLFLKRNASTIEAFLEMEVETAPSALTLLPWGKLAGSVHQN